MLIERLSRCDEHERQLIDVALLRLEDRRPMRRVIEGLREIVAKTRGVT